VLVHVPGVDLERPPDRSGQFLEGEAVGAVATASVREGPGGVLGQEERLVESCRAAHPAPCGDDRHLLHHAVLPPPFGPGSPYQHLPVSRPNLSIGSDGPDVKSGVRERELVLSHAVGDRLRCRLPPSVVVLVPLGAHRRDGDDLLPVERDTFLIVGGVEIPLSAAVGADGLSGEELGGELLPGPVRGTCLKAPTNDHRPSLRLRRKGL
jgi:hypothetical protein